MQHNANPYAAARPGIMHGVPAVKPHSLWGTLGRLFALTRGQRQGLGFIALLTACASAASILSPLLIGRAVNAIDGGDPAAALVALLAGLYLGDACVRFLQQYFMAAAAQRIVVCIRTALFSAMKKLPLAFFDRHRHGELMSRLTNDVDNISTNISDSLAQFLIYAFTIVGVLFVMLWLNLVLTAAALTSLLMVVALTRVITRRTHKLFYAQQEVLGRLDGQVEESVSGVALVKAFCREDAMNAAFRDTSSRYCDVATRALIWSGFLMPMTNVINNITFVIVAVASGLMAERGLITIGLISSFLLYSRQFSRPFVDIANIYNNFQTAVAGAERVFEVLDETPEPADGPDALPLAHPAGDVEFRHVTFGYDPEKPVLRDVSIRIPAGTRTAIVGPTGAGKTTFINLLTRFYDVDGGEILLDGHDLRAYRMADLRRAFGVVLQDPALFRASVRDNIACGRPGATLEDIRAAARMAGADGFIRRLPDGYDTVIGAGGATLSQGECQLLTIARALLSDAPLVILDEATSSVDTLTEQKIRCAMLAATRGRTSFIIAHRLSTIRDSDLILVVEDGRITEQGTHETLMARDGFYAAMYRTQTGLS